MTTPSSINDELEKAYNIYHDFGTKTYKTDHENFWGKKGKLQTFLDQFPGSTNNPAAALMMFFTCVLSANGAQHGPFGANDASVATNYNDQFYAASKALDYASAFRDATTYIKQEFEKCKDTSDPNAVKNIQETIGYMKTYLDPSKFDPKWAPQIFQGATKTFNDSFDKIQSLLDTVNKNYGGDIHKLWVASQQVGDTTAGGLIQTFTNASDTLFSTVSTQQNVLQSQIQTLEANYQTIMSSVSGGMNIFFSVSKYVLNNSGAK